MGKVYIGVMAVGGHKLWVVGGKRVAGSGVLGEWVSGGRLTAGGGEVAGRACPTPTGWRKGERVPAGRCAGVGWFRAISVGGGVLDVPRRGQAPSLRCGVRRGGKAVTGGYEKRAGRACPVPTGRRKGEQVLVGGIIGPLTAVRASISRYGARGGKSGPGSCRGRGRSRSGCGPRKSADG